MAYVSTSNISIFDNIRSVFINLAEHRKRAQKYRTTLNELNAFSNHELADLGIYRSDIKRIAIETSNCD